MLLRWVLLPWEEGRTRRGAQIENVFNITELMRLEEGRDSPRWFPNWLLIPGPLIPKLKQFIQNRLFSFSSFFFSHLHFLLITCRLSGNSSCVPGFLAVVDSLNTFELLSSTTVTSLLALPKGHSGFLAAFQE